MRQPLTGFRVVEVTAGVLGPLAGVYLSDMGADVIKIEPPEGDLARHARGVGNTLPAGTPGALFTAGARGKRSVTLDAGSERGREILRRLLAEADVFLTNNRPKALERLGLTYEQVREINPRIVYASATGFGSKGPDADAAMVDGAGQARAGLASLVGPPDGPPLMVGAIVADTAGAMQLALATVTALLARERHGVGQQAEVSALGGQLWLQSVELTHAAMTGHELARDGGHHPNFVGPYGTYLTADGEALFCAGPPDTCWPAFCEFGGRPDLATDERWDNLLKRVGFLGPHEVAQEIRPHVAEVFRSRTLAEWLEFFSGYPEVIAAKVQGHAEVLEDPQVAANGYLAQVEIPGAGPRTVVGNLVGLSETPGRVRGGPPERGEHTAEVLAELGYTTEEIDAFARETEEILSQGLSRGAMGLTAPPGDD